ncbi:MAG: outer membrane lipoprotein-sorting protein [Gallionella sp.]|nr:outer membrane lipoprotein-sorting protein [Gallionella sp.]MDD4946895.1 outer membrane lipoprotein-sorting protein [Gallionella sp.]
MKNYLKWVLNHRILIIILTLIVTVLAISQARHLKIIIDPNTMLPQTHPYVETTNKVEKIFGSKYIVVIGITPKHGDIYQPAVLNKVQQITASLLKTQGVVKENLLSLSARRAKNIAGTADGLEVTPLMAAVPSNGAQMLLLKQAVHNNPAYLNAIISKDERTTAIIAEFKDGTGGFRSIMDKVNPIIEHERDPALEINVGGMPSFLSQLEVFSERMVFLLPISIVIVGVVLYSAFRSKQGLILPLSTAGLAVIWGIGTMGAFGIPMDVFNASTPILILAVAAGHAVQLLKRYYEEYHNLRDNTELTPAQANKQAVIDSLTRVGPVMITAGLIAAMGFFSLIVFEISTVRTFGIFTGVGILAALILEMTFIPALRSMLSPPDDAERDAEKGIYLADKITGAIGAWVTRGNRSRIYIGTIVFVLLALVGMERVIMDNSTKSFFSSSWVFQHDDEALNARLGGTNTLYLLIEGPDDVIKEPETLRAIDEIQHYLEEQPYVGKTLSMADFIKRMHQAMNGDDPKFFKIPDSRELISQYLLLYSMSGEPGDFDSYVDYGYRSANLTVYLKTDSSAYVEKLIAKLNAYATTKLGKELKFSIGGSVPQTAALNESMVHGKLMNILQISAVVFVISAIVFRSLIAGFLVLVPLMIAVVANFGLMGWTGMLLNIPTSLTSAMAVGIGADYAIYLIYRLREELAQGHEENVAIRKVLTSAGKASLFVASAVAAGYGVLLFSFGFYIHIWMAILISMAMLVSAFAALLLIPSLILTFRPNFIFRSKTMKTSHTLSIFALTVFAATLSAPDTSYAANESAVNAKEIMEKNFMASKVMDSVSNATFTLINNSGQERVRQTVGVTKLQANGIDNMRMTRFMSPSDVKGTVSLLIEHTDKDDDIWIYLPALKKVRRLVASNKKDSFVGTDFSYGDVIGQKVNEWDYTITGEEVIEGKSCFVIESLPKSDAIKSSSGYSKRREWIRKDNYMAVKSEFWDEAGQKVKISTFNDIQLVDPAKNKWQAMRLEANNVQTGHRTVIKFDDFKVPSQVADDYFTTRYMEKSL